MNTTENKYRNSRTLQDKPPNPCWGHRLKHYCWRQWCPGPSPRQPAITEQLQQLFHTSNATNRACNVHVSYEGYTNCTKVKVRQEESLCCVACCGSYPAVNVSSAALSGLPPHVRLDWSYAAAAVNFPWSRGQTTRVQTRSIRHSATLFSLIITIHTLKSHISLHLNALNAVYWSEAREFGYFILRRTVWGSKV